jgi:hypothetical protein
MNEFTEKLIDEVDINLRMSLNLDRYIELTRGMCKCDGICDCDDTEVVRQMIREEVENRRRQTSAGNQ